MHYLFTSSHSDCYTTGYVNVTPKLKTMFENRTTSHHSFRGSMYSDELYRLWARTHGLNFCSHFLNKWSGTNEFTSLAHFNDLHHHQPKKPKTKIQKSYQISSSQKKEKRKKPLLSSPFNTTQLLNPMSLYFYSIFAIHSGSPFLPIF